jgi:hypothetical protein
MQVSNKFGDTLGPYDLSARKELERRARQEPKVPPEGSLYDLDYVNRVQRHVSGEPRRRAR